MCDSQDAITILHAQYQWQWADLWFLSTARWSPKGDATFIESSLSNAGEERPVSLYDTASKTLHGPFETPQLAMSHLTELRGTQRHEDRTVKFLVWVVLGFIVMFAGIICWHDSGMEYELQLEFSHPTDPHQTSRLRDNPGRPLQQEGSKPVLHDFSRSGSGAVSKAVPRWQPNPAEACVATSANSSQAGDNATECSAACWPTSPAEAIRSVWFGDDGLSWLDMVRWPLRWMISAYDDLFDGHFDLLLVPQLALTLLWVPASVLFWFMGQIVLSAAPLVSWALCRYA